MNILNRLGAGLVFVHWLGSGVWADENPQPRPLAQAHSHNDYEHERPLLDALDAGFCSVEADVYLIDGNLLVAHDRDKVSPERTLQRLYLDPLKERARRNGGSVHAGGDTPPFFLLIDLKSEAEATYSALHDVLVEYDDLCSEFRAGKMTRRAVTVIISGNRPKATMLKQSVRYAGHDGRLGDLGKGDSTVLMPWISDNYRSHFSWNGEGEMPEDEKEKLRDLLTRAHAEGKMLRLWATPDVAAMWEELRTAGADLINTDRLEQLSAWLSKAAPAERP